MKKLPFLALLAVSTAFAQSLEEKQARSKGDDSLAWTVKNQSGNCKITIESSIDWSTWKSATDGKPFGVNGGSVCSTAYQGIQNTCAVSPYTHDKKAAAIAQEMVAKNIKKFVCKGDAGDPQKPTFDLKDGTFTVHVDVSTHGDLAKKVVAWLGQNLQ